MKISESTLETLSNFATINQSIYLKEGNSITTRSDSGGTYADYTLADEEKIDFNVAIFDLKGFLNILQIVGKDSEIFESPDKTELIIKNDKATVHWPAIEPESIRYPKSAIKFPDEKVKFELSAEILQKIMKVSRALGADYIIMGSAEGVVQIKSFNKKLDLKLEKPLCVYDIGQVDESLEFNYVFKIENFKLVNDDYVVKLWAKGPSSLSNKQIAAKFEGKNISYILAVEKETTHNF